MKAKINQLLARFDEVEEALGKPDAFNDPKSYRALTQEHSYLSQVKNCASNLESIAKQIIDNRKMLKEESDAEFLEVLQEDLKALEERKDKLEKELENLLVPPDPTDHGNTIMELRAGTGGDEAALFVGDCVRMYQLYADKKGWKYEKLSSAPSEIGGFKEYVMVLSGENVHRLLRYEAGTHRVQRVPETETQGRVHTSAITVAILLEPSEEEELIIDEKDLRIDTLRSSGAGGQHVNTTDSAVRITHIPTGIVAFCQEERSQHKNKAKALRVLNAKVAEGIRLEKEQKIASQRSQQVGSGDRSERIRTYNFAQNRITDHRINLTLYQLDRAMNGELDDVTTALVAHYHQEKLAAEGEAAFS
ncbi:MAG: peptide chain release factor 1 [Parachlamydiales bacterium]|nr:peptide chain release factor 1 [Parachlamydiales bacterium]